MPQVAIKRSSFNLLCHFPAVATSPHLPFMNYVFIQWLLLS
nr:MAG TPA: hypothetical protein [Crassvirales sp.]